VSIINELIESSRADIELLRVRDAPGDVFAIRRPVDSYFEPAMSARRR
jgi:hypothetical protein